MTEPAPSEASTAQTGREGRVEVPRGGVVVADYVGASAIHAARAIRRAGLRPGLERTDGCEPELIGRVIAQKPSAGGELARNAMVTLYVGAPAGAPPDDGDADALPQWPQLEPAGSGLESPSATQDPERERGPEGLRRSKPALAHPSQRPLETRPAPIRADRAQPLREPASAAPTDGRQLLTEGDVRRRQHSPESETYRQEDAPELWRDELLACAHDVLSGRTGGPRRRVYPARRALGAAGPSGEALGRDGNGHERRRWL